MPDVVVLLQFELPPEVLLVLLLLMLLCCLLSHKNAGAMSFGLMEDPSVGESDALRARVGYLGEGY